MSYFDEGGSFGQPEKPTLEATVAALRAGGSSVTDSTIYYGLSGLMPSEIETISPTWAQLDTDYRAQLLIELAEASESNFELDYRELGYLGLNDDSPAVRAAAIDLLWEDESPEFLARLVDFTAYDESPQVRARAASTLGRFILLGEYGQIRDADATRAQDAVISLWNDTDEGSEVRRRALEAVANCGHEMVTSAIQEAYTSSDLQMRASAVFAMGRTCDDVWQDTILRELKSSDAEMRYEAARAAGELELSDAIPMLARLAVEDDREIREVAVWSLGEIGGRDALRVLSALAQDADELDETDLLEAIEDAIANATLIGDTLDLDTEVDER